METQSWEARAAAKRADTLDKIPKEWRLSAADLTRAEAQRDLTGSFIEQFLTPEEIAITTKDSVSLVNEIKERQLTAVQVTTAFCKRAAIAHQIVNSPSSALSLFPPCDPITNPSQNNCLHEIFFTQALARAAELDALHTTTGTTTGSLHGLPISLKDQFHVKGVDTTMGYIGWIGSNLGITNPSQAHLIESQLTTELLSLGAVLYCKTSLPQTLLFGETKNNIIGQTLNPHNHHLSCGGSSGGEGALLALGGSNLGVGTDIGGSVRIPAAFNGVFSLKPTPERLSYRDVANTNPGQDTYRSTVGFLSTSLGGLELGLRAVLGTRPWVRDPAVVPIPFREEVARELKGRMEEGGLKFGVLW